MFRRRVPLGWKARLREIVFPRKGFNRLYSYMAQRVLRMSGTPYSLACGIACGVCVSFTPFIGFHLILAALLAYLLRGNVIASWAGTIVGNPWTFPLIFILLHETGNLLMVYFGLDRWVVSTSDTGVYGQFLHHFIPMAIGGVVFSILSWCISFGLAYWAIVSWRRHRARRIEAKQSRQSMET